MLAYRHGFHAGNFADVMKHVALVSMLRYMTQKDAPLCYVDTHAGAGDYDLTSDAAAKTGEYDTGIARIRDADDAPGAVADYLDLVRACNSGNALAKYPGSPRLAAMLLRPQDRLMLCELHSSDFALLKKTFANDRRVHCHAEDGYRFSVGLVPPRERRGLIVIDPSYELKDEYRSALAALDRLQRRFATGVYVLWYPLLVGRQDDDLRRRLDAMETGKVLRFELTVSDRDATRGMYGCGMLVINPPWTLRDAMADALPWLASRLGRNSGAGFRMA